MKERSLSDARHDFSALVDEVLASGESIVVTRRGKPVVKLVPCGPLDSSNPHPLRGLPICIPDDFDSPTDDDWEALDV